MEWIRNNDLLKFPNNKGYNNMVPNWHNGPVYSFCGYTYEYDIMDDGDCRKIWHDVKNPNGEIVDCPESINWSSYHYPTEEEFEDAVIDLMLRDYFKSIRTQCNV